MKYFVRMAALAAAATIIATPASAQSGPANATARIIKPLTLTANRNLDFGDVIVWDAGDITVASDNAAAITCDATLECDDNGVSAQYTITGTNGHTIQVNTASSTLTNQGPGSGSLTFNPASVPDQPLGNSGRSGVSFYVGGTISIPQGAEAGTYVGDMDVTVEY
jgi:hypothetical protein